MDNASTAGSAGRLLTLRPRPQPSMTSIHFAAWSGNGRVLPQLVRSKGFSPDDEDVDGWTPLHFAALAGQDELVRMLLQLGCHPDRWSKYGSTPAMVAGAHYSGRAGERCRAG